MRTGLALALVFLGAVVSPASRAQQRASGVTAPAEVSRVDQLETLLTELVERLEVLAARIRQLEDTQYRLIETVNELGVGTGQESARSTATTETNTSAAPAREIETVAPPQVDGESLEADYRAALLLQAEGKFNPAMVLFETVYESDPDGDLADNALFWLGEIRFAMKDYQSAIKMFERLTVDYPDGDRAPDALLRVGFSYSALGDLLMARGVFERVIERYPYSTAAENARSQLEKTRY